MLTPEQVRDWIAQNLPCDMLEVRGDGHHFEAVIVSPEFAGLNRVRQHQRVYTALGERMKAEIHALSMQTFSPEEWAKRG